MYILICILIFLDLKFREKKEKGGGGETERKITKESGKERKKVR